MKKHVSVPSISFIPWKSCPILLVMYLGHFIVYLLSQVCIVLVFVCLWACDSVHLPQMHVDLSCGNICKCPILSYLVHYNVGGWVGYYFSGQRNCGHMVRHDIVPLELCGPFIVSIYQCYFDGAVIIWLCV